MIRIGRDNKIIWSRIKNATLALFLLLRSLLEELSINVEYIKVLLRMLICISFIILMYFHIFMLMEIHNLLLSRWLFLQRLLLNYIVNLGIFHRLLLLMIGLLGLLVLMPKIKTSPLLLIILNFSTL